MKHKYTEEKRIQCTHLDRRMSKYEDRQHISKTYIFDTYSFNNVELCEVKLKKLVIYLLKGIVRYKTKQDGLVKVYNDSTRLHQ